MSKIGYCSRARASELIRAGRVALNGKLRRDPETPVRLPADRIEVDGRSIAAARKIYLALNKPRGLLTTTSDEWGRDTIYECLSSELPWLAPVGRLDKASEGLLFLTNDSEWAARVLDPESHLEKTYHVQIAALPDEALLQSLRQGIRTAAGGVLRFREVRILRQGQRNAWLEVLLDEGKNRQIRRMLESVGIEVLRLVRVAIGPLPLGELAKGATRELTHKEKQVIDASLAATGGSGPVPRTHPRSRKKGNRRGFPAVQPK